jgi:hypothetical protein
VTRLKAQEGTIAVPVDVRFGGGVIDGKLLSYYECPKCRECLRFIAVFESAQAARQALESMEDLSKKMEIVRSGRAVVGTATYMSMYGPRTHGGSGYGYYSYSGGCVLLPYYGMDRDLAREIWDKLHRHSKEGAPPLPAARLDVTRLEVVVRAEDRLNPTNPPLLMYESRLLQSPEEVIVGRWNTGEPYERWKKRMEEGPCLFLQKVSLQTFTV